ncbi:ABC transporter ATP-binding protein [Clostridium tetani]|uniref:Putative taurine transport ATP-binding protein tauB n=1 Tax=Clostridium tetani (strain Massachusetts / E88) TaxID=212717 RepID=Q894Y7_CLOTE|nr:ABC transporter ATP-binding protein [Clostridium tetani]AAO35953.1 putative taurine transport ATP-binding protein tauB [Clostridium tetani E88]KGI38135.1 ABC transporter ATP-binding protein [Clostridium tetani]KGI41925.1 ABC transporter ATP-binding protein [Clostridium tetani]KGI45057.1 ABC transporter ATP-binding protein [Clostridium tetani]KHO32488.1 ABC transporter ATP-binding protein [Clostridium tetani]
MNEILNDKKDYVVSLKDINLSYSGEKGDVSALQNINLDINEGEFICVLGPSGCGKSTLLKIIAGFLKPSDGTAAMDGQIINEPNWHRGVVFQSPTLYPWLNIHDNVAFGLKMRKFPKNDIEELTNKYLDLVGLNDFKNLKPYELSGGMKQRASLARVLVNKPRMILMDEPFGALDALTRENMQTLIRTIWTKTKNTVFLITHDVDEALSLATRIIVLSKRPGKILKEFNTEFTYEISGTNNENVRYSAKYMEIREEILNIINSQN